MIKYYTIYEFLVIDDPHSTSKRTDSMFTNLVEIWNLLCWDFLKT